MNLNEPNLNEPPGPDFTLSFSDEVKARAAEKEASGKWSLADVATWVLVLCLLAVMVCATVWLCRAILQ